MNESGVSLSEFLTEFEGTHGKVRVERDFMDPYKWMVFRLVPIEDGIHPIHKSETTEKDVWLQHPKISKTKGAALELARSLL